MRERKTLCTGIFLRCQQIKERSFTDTVFLHFPFTQDNICCSKNKLLLLLLFVLFDNAIFHNEVKAILLLVLM